MEDPPFKQVWIWETAKHLKHLILIWMIQTTTQVCTNGLNSLEKALSHGILSLSNPGLARNNTRADSLMVFWYFWFQTQPKKSEWEMDFNILYEFIRHMNYFFFSDGKPSHVFEHRPSNLNLCDGWPLLQALSLTSRHWVFPCFKSAKLSFPSFQKVSPVQWQITAP